MAGYLAALSAMWFLFLLYGLCLQQWMRTVTTPIRADLCFLAPLLYFLTVFGVWQVDRSWKSQR